MMMRKWFIFICFCILFAFSGTSQANLTVEAGWDLFKTDTAYLNLGSGPIPFEGVPLEVFDWPGTLLDNEDLGNVDTIVERQAPADVIAPPDTSAPIPIEIVALQLVSVSPIDVGAGLDYHYATLQSGVASTGTMDITFDSPDGGTFDSIFDVWFDLRFGALDGPILFSGFKTFIATGVEWARESIDIDAITMDGINHLLDGTSIAGDFWPPSALHDAGDGSQHGVSTGTPEPATMVLLGLGGFMLRKRR